MSSTAQNRGSRVAAGSPGAMRAPRRASSPIPPLHHRAQPTSLHRGTLRLHRASRARPTALQHPPPLALAKSPPATHRVSTNCSCTTLLPLPTGVDTLTQPPGSTPARRQQPPPQRRGVSHEPGRGNPPAGRAWGRTPRPTVESMPCPTRVSSLRSHKLGCQRRVGKVGRCRRAGSL